MNKLIVILGKSSSGKTTLAKLISKKLNAKTLVANTSRDIRDSEVEGIDYYFKTRKQFEIMISNNEFIEYNEFNNWYYGLDKKELLKYLNQTRVVVLNPNGYKELLSIIPSCEILPIYIECDDSVRLMRSLDRKDDPKEVCRRYFTDAEDFKDIKKLVLSNNGVVIDTTYKSSYETFSIVKKILKNYM